jgi:hypothetical protein
MTQSDAQLTLTVTVDPTSYRLLTRFAEVEHVPMEKIAADLIRFMLRGVMPESYDTEETDNPLYDLDALDGPSARPSKN